MADANSQAVVPPPKGRLLFGGAVFVLGLLCPLLVPLVAASDLPTEWKTVLSGLLLLASLLVLGGDFWDKLRALFVRDAKVQFSDRGRVIGLGGVDMH